MSVRCHPITPLFVALALSGCVGKGPGPADTDLPDGTHDTDQPDTDAPDTDLADTDDRDTDLLGDTDLPGPPKPSLGVQRDRVGRPGVNTLFVGIFTPDRDDAVALHDAYNADTSWWAWSLHAAEIQHTLRVLDGVDGVCANQLAADPHRVGATHAAFTAVLADDRIYLNVSGASCSEPLAVEVNGLGLRATTDCGGRPMDMEMVDALVSYSILGTATGAGDGIPAGQPTPDFPFFAEPR